MPNDLHEHDQSDKLSAKSYANESKEPNKQVEKPVKTTAYAWYALTVLTIIYAVNFMDRQILVVLQESIKRDLGFMDWQLGMMHGFAFALFYAVMGLPIAALADRANRKWIVSIGLLVWSAMTAITGATSSFVTMLLARIGVGVGEAAGNPPSHAMIADMFPIHRRGIAMGIYTVGGSLGIVFGFLLGGILDSIIGWRWTFVLAGLPGIVLFLILALTMRDPKRGQFDALPAHHHPNESVEKSSFVDDMWQGIKMMFQLRTILYLSLGAAMSGFAGYGVGNWIPPFLERVHGLATEHVAIILAITVLCFTIPGAFIGGFLGDMLAKRDRRWYAWIVLCPAILTIPSIFIITLSSNTLLVLVFLCVTSFFMNFHMGPVLALLQSTAPIAMRARASALLLLISNLIGMGFGPLLAGALSDIFTKQYGVVGISYAILVVSLIGTIGLVFYALASTRINHDTPKS